MSDALERRLQDAVYESLELVEHNDLSDRGDEQLAAAVRAAEGLAALLQNLCDQSPSGTSSS
jgi:hypothetical protein